MASGGSLRVVSVGGTWHLVGSGVETFGLINDFLGYLADRAYSPSTVRAYAFDLLAFCRWLLEQRISLEEVTTEVLLRFLAACRAALLPGRCGDNVFSIRDGRDTGYAATTVNRRLAAISGLFAYRAMRHPERPNPVPRGREARRTARGERTGLLGHLAKPRARSMLRLREPRRLPRGLQPGEARALLSSFRTVRDRAIAGLMLLSGLRSAEVLSLQVPDVDVPRGWARVVGKGDKERRVPLDPEVAGLVQTYLLAERPETAARELFVVAKGPHRGQRLTAAGLRTVFRYHRVRSGVPDGHPHALRHTFGTAWPRPALTWLYSRHCWATTTLIPRPPTSTWHRSTYAPPTMPPASASAPAAEPELLRAYLARLQASGRAAHNYVADARRFFARWPDPQTWARGAAGHDGRQSVGSAQLPPLPGSPASRLRLPARTQTLGASTRTAGRTVRSRAASLRGRRADRGLRPPHSYRQCLRGGGAPADPDRPTPRRARRAGFCGVRGSRHRTRAPARSSVQALSAGPVRGADGDLPPGWRRRAVTEGLQPLALELGTSSGGRARAFTGLVCALPGVLRRHPRSGNGLAYGLTVGALRPAAGQARSQPDVAGRPRPAAPYRALPAGRRRRPASLHGSAALRIRATLPDPADRTHAQLHRRVGLARSACTAVDLCPRRASLAAGLATLSATGRRSPLGP